MMSGFSEFWYHLKNKSGCLPCVFLLDTTIYSVFNALNKEHLAIRRTFSLVDMITNTKFSNCPNVFEIGVVWQ